MLGAVQDGEAGGLLLVRPDHAIAEDLTVTLVVIAEQPRGEVIAAAVPLAAFGIDLHLQ
jgi:mannose/fructose/N-acetylgalactosamine-specific phosphotransferase system component IIC